MSNIQLKHLHVTSCPSTQDTLKELIQDNSSHHKNFLVTTETQTQGRGTHSRKWDALSHSLAFSFNIKAHSIPSLTSSEMSLLVAFFLKEHYSIDIFLKWPNDLINAKGEKCCGILIEEWHNMYLCGIGINLYPSKDEKIPTYSTPGGFLFKDEVEIEKKELASIIVNYIHGHRITEQQRVLKEWESLCSHLNQKVINESNGVEYLFHGLGSNGQALLKKEDEIIEHYSGSLLFLF